MLRTTTPCCHSTHPLAVLLGLSAALGSVSLGCTELGENSLFSDVQGLPAAPRASDGGSALLSAEQVDTLKQRCATSGCHTGPTPQANLALDRADLEAALVNIASVTDPTVDLAEPGDPANSMFIRRLRGQNGTPMPLGQTPLSEATIAGLESWVRSLASAPARDGEDPVEAPAGTVAISFCNPYELKAGAPVVTRDGSGSVITLVMTVGDVDFAAASRTCSPCAPVPVGNLPFRLRSPTEVVDVDIEGDLVVTAGTEFILLPSIGANEVKVFRLVVKDGLFCEDISYEDVEAIL